MMKREARLYFVLTVKEHVSPPACDRERSESECEMERKRKRQRDKSERRRMNEKEEKESRNKLARAMMSGRRKLAGT